MILDLTRPIHTGMPIYPGDPEVELEDAGTLPPWSVSTLQLGSHSGTHMDAASHYVRGGRTIDQYQPDRFVLDAWVVRAQAGAQACLAWEDLAGQLPPAGVKGAGVLLDTGWAAHWGTDEAWRHPYLSAGAARGLVDAGITLVGTDAFNVDTSARDASEVHAVLLGADVLIVENLTSLRGLVAGRPYRCLFLPLRLAGADGSPVRALVMT